MNVELVPSVCASRFNSLVRCSILAACVLFGTVASLAVRASFFGSDVAIVTIKTVDAKGTPIPWVTVGAAWTPFPPLDNKDRGPWPRLQPGDLKRLLLRNLNAWEYWNQYLTPVMYLRFSGLTDRQGLLKDQIDYVDAAGRGSEWPDELTVTYGAYRYGYQPVTGSQKVHKNDRGLEITLVLEPSPNDSPQLPEYLQTYYEIRHELSDRRRNEDISLKNYERLENLRKRLTEAAESAAAKSDHRAAAQIMYWVAYMPEVTVFNGKPNGFAQTTESLRNYEAIKKAAEYDPDNAHILMQAMLYESWWWNRENDAGRITYAAVKQLRRQWLERAVALDKRAGPHLWGKFYEEIANTHGFFGMYQEQIDKLAALDNYDPSWASDLGAEIERIKKRTR